MSKTSELARKMMSDMGWKEGMGLGKEGQGMVTALKPSKKLDNSGLGAHSVQSKWITTSCVYDNILAKLQIAHAATDLDAVPDSSSDGHSKKSKKDKKRTPEEESKEDRKQRKRDRKAREAAEKEESEDDSDKETPAKPNRAAMYSRRLQSKRVQGYSEADKAEIFGLAARTEEVEEKVKQATTTKALFGEFDASATTANKAIAYEGGFTEDTQVDIYNQAMDSSIKGRVGLGLGKKLSKAERRDVAQRDARLMQSGTYLYRKFEYAGLLGELLEESKASQPQAPPAKPKRAPPPEEAESEEERPKKKSKKSKKELVEAVEEEAAEPKAEKKRRKSKSKDQDEASTEEKKAKREKKDKSSEKRKRRSKDE